MEDTRELDLPLALGAAVAAVTAAGRLLLELREKPVEVLSEAAHDIKLKADQLAEECILGVLRERMSLPVLTEESGEHGELDEGSCMWVVDPLDGTFNYSRGMPMCCSSVGLWADGRPMPVPASGPEVRVPADLIVLAVGQDVLAKAFVPVGVDLNKNGTIHAESTGQLSGQKKVFAGGDCVTGPATVIKAIAAGKVAAANIDQSLGFHHLISTDVQVPNPRLQSYPPTGRVQLTEREASDRRHDFTCIECGMTGEEAQQESLRCLRCDHFGYGIFKGGRIERW